MKLCSHFFSHQSSSSNAPLTRGPSVDIVPSLLPTCVVPTYWKIPGWNLIQFLQEKLHNILLRSRLSTGPYSEHCQSDSDIFQPLELNYLRLRWKSWRLSWGMWKWSFWIRRYLSSSVSGVWPILLYKRKSLDLHQPQVTVYEHTCLLSHLSGAPLFLHCLVSRFFTDPKGVRRPTLSANTQPTHEAVIADF